MRRYSTRKWIELVCFLLLLGLGGAYLYARLSRHSPISVVAIDHWTVTMDRGFYRVISPQEILIFRSVSPGVHRAYCYHLDTGQETPWPAGSKPFDITHYPLCCLVSPDRRWLLVETWHKQGFDIFVKSIRGSEEFHTSSINGQVVWWTDDSKLWVEFLGHSPTKTTIVSAHLHDIQAQRETKTYPISAGIISRSM